jgi:hypothetical protein
MKKSLITLAAIAALASASAFAGEADPSGQFALQIQSTRSRADVNAEVVAAVANGTLRQSNPPKHYYPQGVLNSTTTRAQVVADFLADREEAIAMTGEDSGSAYLARVAPAHADQQHFAAR